MMIAFGTLSPCKNRPAQKFVQLTEIRYTSGMRQFATKLDMNAIRLEGQSYLSNLEQQGHVLPSLHEEKLQLAMPTQRDGHVEELQGFSETKQSGVKNEH
jgi:hypothetical protein